MAQTLTPEDLTAIVNAVLGAIVEGPTQYDGLGEAGVAGYPPTVPTGQDVTVAMALRAAVSYTTGQGTNLDTTNGQAILRSYVGGRQRVVAQLVNGNRTITSRDLH